MRARDHDCNSTSKSRLAFSSRMRDIEPAGGCQYHSLKSTRRWLSYLVAVRPTRNLSRHSSPAVFKAEIILSGERVAARFACGAESLAVYRQKYSFKV